MNYNVWIVVFLWTGVGIGIILSYVFPRNFAFLGNATGVHENKEGFLTSFDSGLVKIKAGFNPWQPRRISIEFNKLDTSLGGYVDVIEEKVEIKRSERTFYFCC